VDPTGLPWVDADQRRMVLDALRAGERVRDVEVRMRTSTGETRTALLFAERIRLEDEPHELSVFIDVSARKRAEQQVRDLASRLTIAEQEERRRMARVLHDDLQQRLYGVRYKLEGIRRAATAEHGVLRELAPLDEIERWLDASIEEMRHLTVDLSPPVLVGEGLSDALPWLVEQMKEAHGLDVLVETNKTHKMRDPEIRILAFQIVRELLFNVVKHAGVSRAEVAFGEEDGVWRIDVRDRGVGFDVAKLQGLSTELASYGLRSLRERISLFGGDLRIESTVGEGTIASVFIPVPRERAS
jgi:signal transduction histidine kinase